MPTPRAVSVNTPKITELLRKKGVTPEALATKAKCSRKTVDSVIAGRQDYISTINKIAAALGVTYTELVAGEAPAVEPLSATPCVRVEIRLDFPFGKFNECTHLIEFAKHLLTLTGEENLRAIVNVYDGSTVVEVELTISGAEHLASNFISLGCEWQPLGSLINLRNAHGFALGAAPTPGTNRFAVFLFVLATWPILAAIWLWKVIRPTETAIDLSLISAIKMPSTFTFEYVYLKPR